MSSLNSKFKIYTLELGPMQNFIYLIEDIASRRIAIVDPAWEISKALDSVIQDGATITDILLTHSHIDHINAIDKVLHAFDAELHLSHAEAKFWSAGPQRCSLHYGGDKLQLGATEIEILHTPGHTPGSVCYRIDDHLITGDTMFIFGCGHCNLGGDPNILFDTLQYMREHLPADTTIHPGHNYSEKKTSTMDEQIQGNPFMHFERRADFVEFRQHRHSKIRNTPYHAISHEQAQKMLRSTV